MTTSPTGPKRIQLRRTAGYRKPEGARSVVRGTDYGNPFKVGAELIAVGAIGNARTVRITRRLAVELFRAHLDEWPGWRDQGAAELHGLDLACYCPLDAPCHADVWLALAAAVDLQESR